MTRAFLYRLAMAAPVAVPLIADAGVRMFGEIFLTPALVLGASLLYTKWTYPAFALVVVLTTRRWSVARLERASLWLPVAYAPLCGIEMATLYGRPFFTPLWWSDFAAGAVLAVAFGYGYVGAVRLLGELASVRAQRQTLPATPPGTRQVPNAR